MSHLHLPDGVLPWWLVGAGWALAAIVVGLSVWRLKREDLRRRIPVVGAVAALMLVAMSSEVIPIAYHINLTVIAGVLLGPWLAIPTAFVVVTVLALIGHGGVTVIGLNTLVIAAEMVLGSALFAAFWRLLGKRRAGWAAGLATVLTLFVTTTMLVGIVALGGSTAARRESGAFDPQTLRFENPFGEGVLTSGLSGDAEETQPEAEPQLALGRFALLVYGLGSIGWFLEALITAGVIGFVARVRPSLVFQGAEDTWRSRVGDEGVHR